MRHGDSPQTVFELRRHAGVRHIAAADWDRLAGGNPFLAHAFLAGLEEFDCLDAHGWQPCPLTLHSGGRLLGAVPLYLRSNSYGEFVFDWAWAEAFERAGGRYFPKLVSAIPFTPVRGPRLLVDPEYADADAVRARLAAAVLDFCREQQLSSFHCLFGESADVATFGRSGLLRRVTCQFRWFNRDYRDFQDFLDALTAKRRKEIRRERRAVEQAGVSIEWLTGAEAGAGDWAAFHEFYCATFEKRWGSPRFTLPFFEALGARMPGSTLLVFARRGGRRIAGAFAMQGNDGIYGRHWGCSEELPFLHFEVCYHQTVERCIREQLRFVDAGVQGEHKLSRGFEPQVAHSCHFLAHAGFRRAVADYLEHETPEVERYVELLRQHLPFRAATAAA